MNFEHDHLHFRCQNYQSASDFYLRMFDGEDMGTVDALGIPVRKVKVGEIILAFSPKRKGVDIGPDGDKPHWGYYQLGLRVDNIEAVVASLKAKGAEFTSDIKDFGATQKVTFMKGPDGMEIELLESK